MASVVWENHALSSAPRQSQSEELLLASLGAQQDMVVALNNESYPGSPTSPVVFSISLPWHLGVTSQKATCTQMLDLRWILDALAKFSFALVVMSWHGRFFLLRWLSESWLGANSSVSRRKNKSQNTGHLELRWPQERWLLGSPFLRGFLCSWHGLLIKGCGTCLFSSWGCGHLAYLKKN